MAAHDGWNCASRGRIGQSCPQISQMNTDAIVANLICENLRHLRTKN